MYLQKVVFSTTEDQFIHVEKYNTEKKLI